LRPGTSGEKNGQRHIEIEGRKMIAAPRHVLLIWVQAALQAAHSGRRPAVPPSEHRALVDDLERLAAELRSVELAAEEGA
jgi:hypothetical protein